jgi:hypothetical protein
MRHALYFVVLGIEPVVSHLGKHSYQLSQAPVSPLLIFNVVCTSPVIY